MSTDSPRVTIRRDKDMSNLAAASCAAYRSSRLCARWMGYESVRAVENPLTSLAHDAERTRKVIAQQNGPVLLVGHSYGGAVITEAGSAANLVG